MEGMVCLNIRLGKLTLYLYIWPGLTQKNWKGWMLQKICVIISLGFVEGDVSLSTMATHYESLIRGFVVLFPINLS